jgi:hypothetical protein
MTHEQPSWPPSADLNFYISRLVPSWWPPRKLPEATALGDRSVGQAAPQLVGPAVSEAAEQTALVAQVKKRMFQYGASDEVLVYLIQQTVDGSPQRRLAAKFILDCLRRYQTREEIEGCIDELSKQSLLDVADDARELASGLGLIRH